MRNYTGRWTLIRPVSGIFAALLMLGLFSLPSRVAAEQGVYLARADVEIDLVDRARTFRRVAQIRGDEVRLTADLLSRGGQQRGSARHHSLQWQLL